MVRALTGCPMVDATAVSAQGQEYHYQRQGESEEYLRLSFATSVENLRHALDRMIAFLK